MDTAYAVVWGHGHWEMVSYKHPKPENRIRVAVVKTSIAHSETQMLRGERTIEEGRVVGHEAVGRIDWIPDSVQAQAAAKELAVGDRVVFFPFVPCQQCAACARAAIEECASLRGIGLQEDGTLATYVDVPVSVLVKAPPSLSWDDLLYTEAVAAALSAAHVPALAHARQIAVVGRGPQHDLTTHIMSSVLPHAVVVKMDPHALAHHTNRFDAVVETWSDSTIVAPMVHSLRVGGTLILKSRPNKMVLLPRQDIVERSIHVVHAPYGSFSQAVAWMSAHHEFFNTLGGMDFPFTPDGIALAIEDDPLRTHVGKLRVVVDPHATAVPTEYAHCARLSSANVVQDYPPTRTVAVATASSGVG